MASSCDRTMATCTRNLPSGRAGAMEAVSTSRVSRVWATGALRTSVLLAQLEVDAALGSEEALGSDEVLGSGAALTVVANGVASCFGCAACSCLGCCCDDDPP